MNLTMVLEKAHLDKIHGSKVVANPLISSGFTTTQLMYMESALTYENETFAFWNYAWHAKIYGTENCLSKRK